MLQAEQHIRCLDKYDFSKNCLGNRSLASGLANNLELILMILKLCMKTDLSRKMTFLNAERKELLSQVEL